MANAEGPIIRKYHCTVYHAKELKTMEKQKIVKRKSKKIVRLNFKDFDKEWMYQYADVHLHDNWSPTPWKTDLMYFLIDWYSKSDTIEATTSGSTGKPKVMLLFKKQMIASARETLNFFKLQPGSSALLCLPIKYIAAKMMVVRSEAGKLNLYCIEPSGYPVSHLTPALDFAAFTPAQFASILATDEGRTFASGIKQVLLGGGTIPSSLEEKVRNLTTTVWHSYGMTETMSHVALRRVNGSGASHLFYPMKGVEMSLTQENCLKITAPHLGVYNLVTNDVATLNSDGGFVILGRKDNVINSGGVKLFPEKIEQKIEPLLKVPFYVTAKLDPKYGTVPLLMIESEQWTEEHLNNFRKELQLRLERIEIPKEIAFDAHFQRTESGKIIRKQQSIPSP